MLTTYDYSNDCDVAGTPTANSEFQTGFHTFRVVVQTFESCGGGVSGVHVAGLEVLGTGHLVSIVLLMPADPPERDYIFWSIVNDLLIADLE